MKKGRAGGKKRSRCVGGSAHPSVITRLRGGDEYQTHLRLLIITWLISLVIQFTVRGQVLVVQNSVARDGALASMKLRFRLDNKGIPALLLTNCIKYTVRFLYML